MSDKISLLPRRRAGDEAMNYIRHLNGFFNRVVQEDRLNPTHISLYLSLFQVWNLNRFENPISISRSEMMKVSKICANATYHKVMKDLHNFGFIQYKPSYNPFRGSEVVLVQLDDEQVHEMNGNRTKRRTKNEQGLNGYHTKIETSSEPINEPYINNTNIINNKHAYEPADENTSSNFDRANSTEKTVSHSTDNVQSKTGGRPVCRNEREYGGAAMPIPTSVEEVRVFFEEEKSTKVEAEKFYNYFKSNGWKVGGRAPMKDWQAAARNWILNAGKFEPKKKHAQLHATTNKDYNEPL